MTNHVERNKQLAREWYALIGSARYEEAKAYVSDDFVYYPMMSEKLEGVDAFIERESAHMDPQPGFTFEIINIIGEGDWVAVHKLIATIRSREISASIILQSQSQLKTIYKDAADTIVGNCDSTLFLGGKEKSTLKEISELLGKETIDLYNQSENRGSQVSHGLSYQKLGKELMTQDELAVMDGGKCIFMLRGVRPFLSDKYDLTRHPNYRYTADADPKNVFDMERYMKKQRAVVKPTDTFDVYEIDATT